MCRGRSKVPSSIAGRFGIKTGGGKKRDLADVNQDVLNRLNSNFEFDFFSVHATLHCDSNSRNLAGHRN